MRDDDENKSTDGEEPRETLTQYAYGRRIRRLGPGLGGSTFGATTSPGGFLLKEDGGYLLKEDGGRIILE